MVMKFCYTVDHSQVYIPLFVYFDKDNYKQYLPHYVNLPMDNFSRYSFHGFCSAVQKFKMKEYPASLAYIISQVFDYNIFIFDLYLHKRLVFVLQRIHMVLTYWSIVAFLVLYLRWFLLFANKLIRITHFYKFFYPQHLICYFFKSDL